MRGTIRTRPFRQKGRSGSPQINPVARCGPQDHFAWFKIGGVPRPADSITQALDNWMDRVQDANLEVHLELLTEAQLDDLYDTVRKVSETIE